MDTIRNTCCVAGCGPAGAVLGLLLARAGVNVVVLEKHADFRRIPDGHTLGFLPRWDFLDFVTRHAERLPTFTLRRRTEVTGLLGDGRRVTGVRARTADGGDVEVVADLVVACDGRDSVATRQACRSSPAAHRSTCCGSACHAPTAILTMRSAGCPAVSCG
ncbi:MAG TPA: FAD-dependent monooxygenase [Euzebyales bacterium]|nr:FAD-dependent monooxygenase [Euzebyales bacterium]